jgi:hypothetical protein
LPEKEKIFLTFRLGVAFTKKIFVC